VGSRQKLHRDAVFRLPFECYAFRPGFIQPPDGIRSKTPSSRFFLKLLGPLMPLLGRALPSQILTTREIGRAMLMVSRLMVSRLMDTRHGDKNRIFESTDIRKVVGLSPQESTQPRTLRASTASPIESLKCVATKDAAAMVHWKSTTGVGDGGWNSASGQWRND
jgi:hypothetical protein